MLIYEETRNSLLSRSKNVEREKEDGKTRFEKRVKCKLSSSVKEYNAINMNSLFFDDILTVKVPVRGETNNYVVTIKFTGFIDILQRELKKINAEDVDLRLIIRALIQAFNSEEVFIHCSCEDFKYRFNYWVTRKDINSGEPQYIPTRITNPLDNKGAGCKHIMLVLSNTQWLMKVSSVINNYIKYMKTHIPKDYAQYIYPALFGKEYEEVVQTSIFDTEGSLDDTEDTINIANEYGRRSGQFKPGNPYRFQQQDNVVDNTQISISDIE